METAAKIYFSIFFLLVVFGMVMVFNINMVNVSSVNASLVPQIRTLLFNFAFAGIAFLCAYLVNLSWFKNPQLILIIVAVMIGLLALTLLIGPKINGARRWIDLGVMRLQPSEYAKIVVVLYLSEVMTKKGERIRLGRDFFGIIVVIGVMLGLMANDLGACFIISGISGALLIMGGGNKKYLFILGAIFSVLAVCALFLGSGYRINRIKAFVDPCSKEYREVGGYQQCQARKAFSIGGPTGVGFGNSTMKKSKELPEAHTDFIFPIIGEEFGFAGTIILVCFFIAMFMIGSFFVWRLNDTFNFYMVSGFVLMLAAQTVLNIFMVMSLLPNKGEPLPFISYGGSALTSYSAMVGLILNAVTSESRR